MIFVTVGTHEQPFNRIVEYMDKWAGEHEEKVIIQTGYSTYEPRYAEWSKLYPYERMLELVKEARIVITHGGPSSFIMPLQIKKTPIVIPRKKMFGEHVNDHQVYFSKTVAERMGTIIVVEDTSQLDEIVANYTDIVSKLYSDMASNNEIFNNELNKIVSEMFKKK